MLTILESMDKRALTIDCAATFHHIMPTEQKREQTGTKLIWRSWGISTRASWRGTTRRRWPQKFTWSFQTTTHPEKTLNNAQLNNAINEKNHGKVKWRRAGSRLGGSQHPQPSRAQSRTISTTVMSPPANKILFDLKNTSASSNSIQSLVCREFRN